MVFQIYEGDGLPCKICPKCLWDVNQSFAFREKVDASNARLLEYVHRMKTENVSIPKLEVSKTKKILILSLFPTHDT